VSPPEGSGPDLRGDHQEPGGGPGSGPAAAPGESGGHPEAGGAGGVLDRHPGQGLPTPGPAGPGPGRAEVLVPLDRAHVGPTETHETKRYMTDITKKLLSSLGFLDDVSLNMQMRHYLIKYTLILIYFQNINLNFGLSQVQSYFFTY